MKPINYEKCVRFYGGAMLLLIGLAVGHLWGTHNSEGELEAEYLRGQQDTRWFVIYDSSEVSDTLPHEMQMYYLGLKRGQDKGFQTAVEAYYRNQRASHPDLNVDDTTTLIFCRGCDVWHCLIDSNWVDSTIKAMFKRSPPDGDGE